MTRLLITIAACLTTAMAAAASAEPDTATISRYNRLFSHTDEDSAQVFHLLSLELQQDAWRRGDVDRYYALQANEVTYETARGEYLSAMRKATAMEEDITENFSGHKEYYNYVYKSLGSIFEHRGNRRMANQYYVQALESLDPDGDGRVEEKNQSLLGNLYISLVRVNTLPAPDRAWQWNETLHSRFGDDPRFLKAYLAHKAQLYFYNGKRDSFAIVKQQYEQFLKSPEAPTYKYGESRIELMQDIIDGNEERAIRRLDEMCLNDDAMYDTAARLYHAMGRLDLAYDAILRRIAVQDTLNNEVINDNLHQLYVTLGMNKLQAESARRHMIMMCIVIALLTLTLVILYIHHRMLHRYQAKIEQQNKQLEVALDKAEESSRMKTTFIQHISHEIRTPLNIITGNAQLIGNPSFELDKEDREQLTQAIGQNTVIMLNMVDNLIEISKGQSKTNYRRDDDIPVNEFCHFLMGVAEQRNTGRLHLEFHTDVPHDYILKSNREGLERILRQVMGNALKFTETGTVSLTASLTAGGAAVAFTVTDTGIGIPPEHHELVFEQFHKVDSFKQGLGVGLYMSRKIAANLGGMLLLDDKYTGGTCMVLTIPTQS